MNNINLPSMGQIPKKKTTKRRTPAKCKFTKEVIAQIPTKKTDYYQTDSVFLRRMTAKQKNGLSLLFRGVVDAEKTLEGGKPIKHPVDAMRWLLEQINSEFEK